MNSSSMRNNRTSKTNNLKRSSNNGNIKNSKISKNNKINYNKGVKRTTASYGVKKEEIKKCKVIKVKSNRKRKKFLISVFASVGLILSVIYLFFNLSLFDLKKIIVNGNSKYTDSEIANKSNFKINENVFLQYFKYKNVKIDELPYIASVSVRLIFPNGISLSVLERESKYILYDKDKNKFFRIDADGYILEETTLDKKQSNEIVVYGITFDNKVGEKINEIDFGKLQMYENIAEEYNKRDINGNITKVDFSNSLTTITLNDKLNVILPNDTNLKYNLDLLNSILKKNGDLQGIIDMTKSDPIFSVF